VAGDPADAKPGGYTTHVMIDHEALVRGHTVEGEPARSRASVR